VSFDPLLVKEENTMLAESTKKKERRTQVTKQVGKSRVQPEGFGVVIQVSDMGTGIPEQRQGAIFQQFSQVSRYYRCRLLSFYAKRLHFVYLGCAFGSGGQEHFTDSRRLVYIETHASLFCHSSHNPYFSTTTATTTYYFI